MSSINTRETRVWDLGVRLFHWGLAAAFITAYLSEDEILIHRNVGYFIGGLVLFRVLWGFIGAPTARFRDFVRPPRQVFAYLQAAVRQRAPRYLGHNPAGGAMIVALLLSLSATIISGIALYGATDCAGPLACFFRGEDAADVLEEIHEFCVNGTLVLIGLHLVGVALSSLAHRENLVRSMLTGRKSTTETSV